MKDILSKHRTLLGVLLVGGSCTLLQGCLLFLFVQLGHMNAVLANTIASEIAILCGFTLNNLWTFKLHESDHHWFKRLGMFNLSALGSVAIQALVIALGVHFFGAHLYLVYAAVGVLLGLVLNYTIYTRVIWKKA